GGVDLDTVARTMTVNVTSVNDAPIGASNAVTTLEDATYTFATADFGFTDPSDAPVNAFLNVKIATLPAAGTGSLTLSGVAVAAGDFVSVANISAGNLKFVPTANANGATAFTFQVQDSGGTANGGVDLDTVARTMTVNVTSVNDAPIGASNAVTTLEDATYTFATADFGFTDPSDAPVNAFLNVKIATLPAAGTGSLTLSGVAVAAGDFVSVANISAGNLKFVPTANANGATAFTFQVQDSGGTANGGVDLDTVARTMTVNVTSVNDAPIGASNAVTTLEDATYTFATADFGFTDPSDAPVNAFLNVKIATLPAAGTGSLTLSGVAVAAGDFVSVANISAGNLKFVPTANANGATAFTFQVQDSGGTANGGVDLDTVARTMTVNVTSVNDAPIGASNAVTTLEDATYTFATADFGFTDPSDAPVNAFLNVKIATLPAAGTGSLTLSGVAVAAGDFVSVANISAGNLKFVPTANANGATAFTFQVQDSGGTANGGVDLDTVARTMTVNVTSVNDAPIGASNAVTTLEDATYTFATADFGFTDPSDAPVNAFLNVKIATLPAAGTGSLTLSGVAVAAGDFVSVANISAGNLKFVPTANANGATAFTFQVQDSGGTANGGVDLDTVARTMTVNVTSVNDAPIGASNAVTTLEDATYTFATADFGFTDPSDAPVNAFLNVKIATLPAAGTGSLTLSGVAVAAGDFVSVANISAGNLKFVPTANANGATAFTFQVQDSG